jgi:hypothetical protein|tara:strand:- start:45 stop:446 length:402 start_codon:yes stop_codon:yes gene_type:complete
MKIAAMNKANAQLVRAILENDLAPILSEYGLKLELGNAGYDSESVKFNGFRISLETALSKDASALVSELAWREKMNHQQLDEHRIHKQGKHAFILTGYKPRATKKPFMVNCLQGNGEFVISNDTAIKWFGVAA